MRVISGDYKGKRLFSPIDDRVRPTTDRIKETMFNILSSKNAIKGDVLDLFSGTGALGIEAISRGADKGVFIDKDVDSIKVTKSNLSFIKTPYEVYNADYSLALKKLQGRQFDMIFADPPYNARIENNILDLIIKYDILVSGGIIIIEHDSNNVLKNDNFDIDTRKCGNTCISFLSYKKGVVNNE